VRWYELFSVCHAVLMLILILFLRLVRTLFRLYWLCLVFPFVLATVQASRFASLSFLLLKLQTDGITFCVDQLLVLQHAPQIPQMHNSSVQIFHPA
jgi:hypothetical protein